METSSKLELLKIVNNKLELKRDELMDTINSSLSSIIPDRINIIYNAQLELATIEKALEINRYFQIQIQEQVLGDILKNTSNYKGNSNPEMKFTSDDEELKK
jgi:hypothetical protein